MRPEDRLLCLCSRQHFTDPHLEAALDVCRREGLDWLYVFDTSRLHGVAPLVYRNLLVVAAAGVDVPEGVRRKFELSRYRNSAAKARSAQRLADVLDYFGRQSVDAMAIKGAALDLVVYDEPALTTAGDTDLVLRPRAGAPTPEALTAEFYRLFPGYGIEFEFHGHHDATMDGVLDLDFDRIWRDAVAVDYRGRRLHLMSDEDMLLTVCINSCRKRFFRLRSLVDIAETLERRGALGWLELGAKARDYGCQAIAFAALSAARETVGCDLSPAALDALAVGRPRAALIRMMVRLQAEHAPLGAMTFDVGREVLGRRLNWTLLLPYATYSPTQVVRKLRLVCRSRRVPA